MDARIARTRMSLQDALLQLARERSLDEITVADIADRAGVNRSSFYQHYSDKDVLLADALDAAVEEAGSGLSLTIEPVSGPPPEELSLYLRHIEQNVTLYRRVLGDHGSAIATARIRDRIQRIASERITIDTVPGFDGVPLDVVAAGVTGSALGVVRAWLEREPLAPVETAAEWMWRVILGPGTAWTTPGEDPGLVRATKRSG